MTDAPAWPAQVAEFLALVDWAAVGFVLFCGLGWLYLLRLDRESPNGFRLVQALSNPDGTASSASMTYVGAFFLMAFTLFYQLIHDRDVDVVVAAIMAGFGTVRVWTASIGAKERTAALNAARPMADPQPTPTLKTTTETTTQTVPP